MGIETFARHPEWRGESVRACSAPSGVRYRVRVLQRRTGHVVARTYCTDGGALRQTRRMLSALFPIDRGYQTTVDAEATA